MADQANGPASAGRALQAPRPADAGPFALAAVGLLTAFALLQAVTQNNFPDFFIYRAGAELGLHHESPYRLDPIRQRVAEQFPDSTPQVGDTEQEKEDRLVNNCGFFLPPQAVGVFAPFAAVPYPAAKVLWALTTGLSAAAVLLLLRTFGTRPPDSLIGRLIPLFLMLNFLTIGIVVVGQTTLLCVGCVAAGQWCFERRRPLLGAVLWAVPFVKPHLALPLLPLAWYLGGWKRAAAVAGVVGGLNLTGCLIAGVSPREYLEFLGASHSTVAFNLVERNYEITGWNRLVFVVTEWFGRPVAVQQTAWVTMGSYLVWFGLVIGRVAVAGEQPTAAWAAAAAAAAAVVCPQVLGYEALMLAVAVPWVRELFAGGWRVRGWAAVVVLGMQAIPFQVADKFGIDFHRPLGGALFAVLVLVGPIRVSRDPEGIAG
ncbi:unnamed protein product [uncultured bacterium]|nr:unnamed protein product [uncultured bacterium]